MKGLRKMRNNYELLNKDFGWNVTDDALKAMFINDKGQFITGEWSEFNDRCSDHSEYYQLANNSVYVYNEPVVFEPETNTLILPNRVLNYKEKDAIHKLVELVDELNADFYIEGENDYTPAMNAILDASASPLITWNLFMAGHIVFIDDDEYNEYDEYEKESVFYTDGGDMFVVCE